MRPQIVKILTLVCSFILVTPMLGQGSPASQGPPAPTQGPTLPELPIDDNIIILMLVAIAYGVFVAYRKNETTNTLQ
ncbi:MAG: hypothetical protein ACI849_000970 [Patiriisocius sp.]|jgi:hypothetical protein